MAVTKMWSVKADISNSLDYVSQEQKTTWDTLCWIDPKTGALYSNRDLAALRHVTDFVGQQPQRSALERTLGYALLEAKTQDIHTSGIHCAVESAREEMELVKRQFGKTGSIQCIHAVQSFQPGEITPEDAHRIGLELAQKLWGDRFQVVVSTHLDQAHIHNHFVINSVSFVDGKRFYRNNESYDLMRVTSDALCQANGLSIVAHPARGRLPTARAYEKAGLKKPRPLYEQIKEDVDKAILQAQSLEDFYRILRRQGYTFRQGKDLKYLSLRPPGASRNCRIEKWAQGKYGLDYSLPGIQAMIQACLAGNIPDHLKEGWTPEPRQKEPPKKDGPKRRARTAGAFRQTPARKSRFQKLYLYYCFKFGVIPKNRKYPVRDPGQLRQMRNLAAQTRLLITNHIDTLEQLNAYQAEKEDKLYGFLSRRKPLYNRLYRAKGAEADSIQADIDRYTNEIKALRREIRLCEQIRARSLDQAWSKQAQQPEKEANHEPTTGSIQPDLADNGAIGY